jgi:integrase
MKKASARGLFERPAGSGCWWINYYVDGKQHREKVGRRGDALDLYQKRKADSRRKLKLPELVPGKVITFSHLSEMAVNHAETHLKSLEHYKTKDSILREPFGERPAADVVSVYTGMRWGEQYSLTWAQVDLKRKVVRLTATKNGSARNVPLNSVTLEVGLQDESLRFQSIDSYGDHSKK